jgi:hypothetical protein
MEKRLKPQAQYWAGNQPGATVRGGAAYHARPTERLVGLVARSSREAARVLAQFARTPGALAAW